MDLSAIYSKTPKGLRARASLIGGLSSHLMKVLTHVDGSAKAETILLKFDKLTPQQLTADLARLEQEGYIRLATVSTAPDDSWALTANFEPMVVEEFQSEEELEVSNQAKTAEQTRKIAQAQAEQQAKQAEERHLAAQLKADKKAQKLRSNEKIKAETKVKAQLEQEQLEQENQEKQRLEIERLALEAAKREAEAQQEAERIAQQQAEHAAKLAEEARLKAELKAREAVEQAEAEAEAEAKENARREIGRISREAEETQKKADAEAKAKQECERLEALKIVKAAEDARQEELKAQAEHEALLEQAAKAAAEQARLEAEAAAQAAEIERLQQAEKAAQEAELQEKLAEKLAQEEKARLDIANVLRKAEDDRKNAVAQAKAEKLEAKRQAKAEQEALAQAERKAKEEAKELARQQKLDAQAEEKALAEASYQAQLEAARIAEEAEIARKNALENEQLQAKQAADILAAQANDKLGQRSEKEKQEQLAVEAVRIRLLADEQASLAAKQNAQLEMERIGREAEQARQKAAQQQSATQQQNTRAPQEASPQSYFPEIEESEPDKDLHDVDFDATEAAEEAAFEAEERAEAAKIQPVIEKPVKPPIVDRARTDINNAANINNAAKIEVATKASVHGKAQPFISAKKIKQWLGSFTKATFIYVPVLVLLALLLLHFINLSVLIKPIEQIASESIGEPVEIKKVHASLWPQPHLVLEDVKVGTGNHIETLHVLPATASLFEEVKVVKSLVIEGLNIEQANFGQPLQWASNASKAKRLKVEQINLKNLTLAIRDLQLESFDGKVTLTDAGTLSSIELVSGNNALSVKISPQGNDSEIVLKATNWLLPFNQKIMFDSLNAKGLASQSKLNFNQIEGEIFGGNLTGQANIEWPDGAGQWLSSGEFALANANTVALLNNFDSAVAIDGKLTLDARFTSSAREASKLASNIVTEANFDVRQGNIQDIELARGVLRPGKQSLIGDDTDFDKLTGSLKFNQGQYQFSKLVLASPQFSANGFINIGANQTTGRVNADLAAQSRHLKANFGITGSGKDLKSN